MNDLISRQDAIDAIVTWTVEDRPDIEMPTDLVGRINALPPTQPEILACGEGELIARPEEAEWIPVESDVPYGLLVQCSKCGTITMINDALEHNYCSECGAKMRSKDNEIN